MYKRSVDGSLGRIEYELTLKRIKSYNLRVREGGRVVVSAPLGVSQDSIDKFVSDRADFIQSARERLEARGCVSPRLSDTEEGSTHCVFGVPRELVIIEGRKNSLTLDNEKIIMHIRNKDDGKLRKGLLERGLFDELYKLLLKICRDIYPLFPGVEFPSIGLRRMTSRWGSCHTKKKRIVFSSELLGYSPRLIEYVAMHEMCHFLYADHSVNFYRELTFRMPDWKERKRALAGKSTALKSD